MQDETMVVLAEYNTITEYMSAIYPIGTMPAQVVVRPEDVEKARAMLQHR